VIQHVHGGFGSRGPSLGHALGNDGRRPGAAGHEDSRPGQFGWSVFRITSLVESLRVQLDPQDFRQFGRSARGHRGGRKDHHPGLQLVGPTRSEVLDPESQISRVRILLDLGWPTAHVANVLAVQTAVHEGVVAAAHRPHVGVQQDALLESRFMFVRKHGSLHRVHAAVPRAVGPAAFAPGAHAIDEHDAVRHLVVRRPQDVAAGRPGGTQQPFEFEARHHVGRPTVAESLEFARIQFVEPGRHHHRAHVQGGFHGHVVEIDGPGIAGLHTAFANQELVVQAGFAVDVVGGRHGLGKRPVDCLGRLQSRVIRVGPYGRTSQAAQAAADAELRIHVPRLTAHPGLEIAGRAIQPDDFRKGVQPYVGMPTGIHHQGAENSDRTIDGREYLVQLTHAPADRRRPLHQVHLESRPREIERGLNARDPATDHQDPPSCGSVHIPSRRLAG